MPSSRSTLTSFLLFSTFALPAVAQVRRLSNFPQQSQLPLTFEPNVGQTDSEVRYVARGGGQTLFLTEDHAVLNLVALEQGPMGGARNARSLKSQKLHGATIRMGFRNSQAPGSIEPLDPLPGKINYLQGNDPSKWHTDVPTYG